MTDKKIESKMTTFDKIAKQTKDLVTLSKNAKAVVKNATTKNSRRKNF